MAVAPSVDKFFNYKCPTEILDALTEEQREKIDTLRTILRAPQVKEGDTTHAPVLRPEHDDDYQLHRFLHAKEYDVGKAREMYEKMVSWRREFGTDSLLADFRIEDTYQKIKKEYIHFYYKTDRLGRPVYIERLGKLNMPGIKETLSTEDMLRFHVREVERLVRVRFPACSMANEQKVKDQAAAHESGEDNGNAETEDDKESSTKPPSQRLGRVCAMLGIVDLDGFGLMKFTSDFISFVKSIARVDQDNYPEILGTLVVINAPTVVSTMWPVIRCFLDKRTQNKIHIFSSYQQKAATECLLSMIDAEDLPDIIAGGKATCSHPDGWAFVDEGPWSTHYGATFYGGDNGWKPPEWQK